jgi:hypothetical protein
MNNFLQAIENLARRIVRPSWFRTREWVQVAPAFRQRAFFSATVTSAKVLSKMRNTLLDWQSEAVEEIVDVNTGRVVTVYKESGLAKFRERSAEFLIQEGLATPEDYGDDRMDNVIGNSRLQLIFNTNLEQASTFAAWQMKMRNEDWLNLYPAARFVRRPGAIIKRQRHVDAENQVRRWDDFAFWRYQNAADIGGFDVPWGPFGFNSYMIQVPVKRKEAERLGLVRKGERVKSPNLAEFGVDLGKTFNKGVEADLDDVSPELAQEARETIISRLGPQAIGADGKPTLDALRQALRGDYRPIAAPVPQASPERERATKKATTQTPQTPIPTGTTSKVSEKISFGSIIGNEKEVKKKWESVVKTIDSVHGDGPLPTAPVRHVDSSGPTNGQYRRFDNEIVTYKEDSIPLTLTHEIGHWIDYRGFRGLPDADPPMTGNKVFASHSPLFKKFIKAAKNTEKIKAITNAGLTTKSKSYLKSNHEIFARAYSQYIAVKSKNPEMLADLKTRQGTPENGKPYPVQWDDDDFIPLYNEIETIFKQIGWLKT